MCLQGHNAHSERQILVLVNVDEYAAQESSLGQQGVIVRSDTAREIVRGGFGWTSTVSRVFGGRRRLRLGNGTIIWSKIETKVKIHPSEIKVKEEIIQYMGM